MKEIRKQNLAKDAYKDPKNAEMIRKLESLEVKDGKIILRVRAKASRSKFRPAAKKELRSRSWLPPRKAAKTEPPRRRTTQGRGDPKTKLNPPRRGSADAQDRATEQAITEHRRDSYRPDHLTIS